MRRIIIGVLITTLVLSSGMGAFALENTQKSTGSESINQSYSHAIFAEYFTMTTCVPCKYAHQALYQLYYEGWHYPYFYYIVYVYNKNNNSMHRKTELQVIGSPTTAFDGGWRNIVGAEDIEKEKTRFNNTILLCAARDVNDIDLSLNVEWLGAVNNYPKDGATKVPIEVVLNWTVTEMKIDVTAKNNEASEYDGHIHVQVTECNSSLWDDKFGYPYTFEFKDYALNQDMLLNAGATFSKTIYWDGMDYTDKGGDDWDPHKFDYITQDNIMVFAAAFDKDNNKYVDETAGFLAGEDTDPKTFDVYFGDTDPPPQVIMNTTVKKFDPTGDLNWTTDYYWKVDVWNALGEKTPGNVLKFTTRGNDPPNVPMDTKPKNGSENVPINTNLTWSCVDPDGDDLTYDIYFGEFDPFKDPPIIYHNWSGTTYKPTVGNLDFETKYAWKIVAWDEYGLNRSGEKWNFLTQENVAPYPAKDPRPPNGAKNVPINATLRWNGSDPNPGDILKYDVYFGPNPNPPLKVSKISNNFYDPPGDMELFLDYYWRIDTYDSGNLMTPGNEWTFTTGINPPPTDPEIDGPTRGNPNVVYDFTFVSFDQDNQTIRYVIDWDDDNITETDLYDNGTVVNLNHSWTKIARKPYVIKAKAIDEYGEESEWSEHEILIPRNRAVDNYNILLSWLFERFPRMFQLLKYLFGL